MSDEQKISDQIAQYQELAKEDKKIDVGMLAMNAMAQAQQEEVAAKKKRWAYLISAGLPPFGLIYAIRYYFMGTPDGKRVALWCVILTVLSLLVAWGIGVLIASSLGPQLNQIQNISPQDLKDLLQ